MAKNTNREEMKMKKMSGTTNRNRPLLAGDDEKANMNLKKMSETTNRNRPLQAGDDKPKFSVRRPWLVGDDESKIPNKFFAICSFYFFLFC